MRNASRIDYLSKQRCDEYTYGPPGPCMAALEMVDSAKTVRTCYFPGLIENEKWCDLCCPETSMIVSKPGCH